MTTHPNRKTTPAALLFLPLLLANGDCAPGDTGSSPADAAWSRGTDLGEGPTCFPIRELRCGDVVASDNGDWNDGATDVLDFYDVAVGNYSGPEITYWFDAGATEEVVFELVDPSPSVINHDLFVLDAQVGCTSAAALEYGFNSLAFEARAGARYYLVVDGFAGSRGPFEARLECSGAPESAPGGSLGPFAPQPDTSEGLTNVSASLEELLEFGALADGCDAWKADPMDRRKKLLCGKARFFGEPMGTDGIPQPLLDWVGRNFPDFAGEGFTEFGLVRDPYADVPRALGFGVSGRFGNADSLGMTCASCHFGAMPDGRFAVGYPNLRYDYGTHMLAIMLGPLAGMPGFDAADHHPDAVAAVQPMIDRFRDDPLLAVGMMMNMVPLLTALGDIPEVPYDVEGEYASWRTGTMDFLTAPLPADDGVHTVSRILPLWGIPDDADAARHGSGHAQLGWTGGTRSVLDFARAFVHVGGGDLDRWPDRELEPLEEYVLSLRAPSVPTPPPSSAVAAGEAVFEGGGCLACHGGPRGGGVEIFDWDEIGTDPQMAKWGDPDGDGGLCCGLSDFDHSYDTGGVKAPRLVGLWAFERFLHNGALDSLEQLLCLEARPPSDVAPFSARGHTFGCDDLSVRERRDLIAYLRTR